MLGLFYRATGLFGLANPMALLLTGALGLGTTIFPFSLVFSNHVPAAAGLMLGLYSLLRAKAAGAAAGRWLAAAGFGTALAVTFDLVAVPFLPVFLGVAVYSCRRRCWPFLIGAALPLIALAALHAGKDIYVEKPLGVTIQEGRILAEAVNQTDMSLCTALSNVP